MNQDQDRLDRFDDTNFTWWQQKVLFFLTMVKLGYIMNDDLEVISNLKLEDDTTLKRRKRKEDEFLCKGHILNVLSNILYNHYRQAASAKKLRRLLESKYKIKEAGNQKFLISNYIDYKISNNKPILDQVYDLQLIISDMKTVGIDLVEDFQVGVIISKLSSTWNNYKKKLKHEEK